MASRVGGLFEIFLVFLISAHRKLQEHQEKIPA